MHRSLVLLVVVALAAGSATAQESRPEGTVWSVGFGVLSAPRPYVGASNTTVPIPLFQLRTGRLSIDGIRASYRLAGDRRLHLDAVGGFDFSGLKASDSPFLAGMQDRDPTVELGLAAVLDRARWGGVLWLRQDVLGRSGGQRAGFDLALRRVLLDGRLLLLPGLGLEWQSGDRVDYYYGVQPLESLPSRPSYRPGAALNLSATAVASYRLGPRLDLVSIVRMERLDGEITASPIVDRRWSWFGLVGLTWRMGGATGGPPSG